MANSFPALLFLASLAAAQSPTSADKGRIEGMLVNQTTGDPVRKGTLTLHAVSTGPVNPGDNSSPAALSTVSDAQGRFAIDQIDPGRYRLTASRPGFLQTTYRASGSSTITVSAGQAIAALRVTIVPLGIISGRVTDEDGDPTTEVSINVSRSVYVNGQRTIRNYSGASVDEQGNFRIANLEPGTYVVSASSFRDLSRSGDGPVQTYYPGVVNPAQAAPVTVAAGAETRGPEFRMLKLHLYRVSGKVVDSQTGVPPENMMVRYMPEGGETMNGFMMSGLRNGTFTFNAVPPGSYILLNNNNVVRVGGDAVPVKPQFVRFPFIVSDHDVTGLVVTTMPGATVTGTIADESGVALANSQTVQNAQSTASSSPQSAGAAPPARIPRPFVRFIPAEAQAMMGNLSQAQAQATNDSTFEVRDVAPAKYFLSVTGLPQGSYIKTIRLGTEDVTNTSFDLASVGGAMTIVVSLNAADVAGAVHNENGASVPDVFITIAPTSAALAAIPGRVTNARTDSTGKFKTPSLPPGEYRVFAWEDVDMMYTQDPDFRAHFEGSAATVKLDEGAHTTLDLKLIPHDVIQAESSKIH